MKTKYRVTGSNIKCNGKLYKIGDEIELENAGDLAPYLKPKEEEVKEKVEYIKKLKAEIAELKAKVEKDTGEPEKEEEKKTSKKGGKN